MTSEVLPGDEGDDTLSMVNLGSVVWQLVTVVVERSTSVLLEELVELPILLLDGRVN